MIEGAREVAAVAAAVGVVGLLAPLPALRSEAQRAGALAVMIVSWGILAASLVPGHDARSGLDRLGSPARAGAAAVAVIVALVVAALVVRAIVARPTIWFVLLGIALPIRIPVSLGSQEAQPAGAPLRRGAARSGGVDLGAGAGEHRRAGARGAGGGLRARSPPSSASSWSRRSGAATRTRPP